MDNSRPWVLVSNVTSGNEVLINLNYVIKIVRIDTVAPVYGICFYHASAGESGGVPTGTQKATYASAVLADAAFAAIVQLLQQSDVKYADLT